MKTFTLFVFSVLLPFISLAQVRLTDSLVTIQDLHFNNAIEKGLFVSYAKKQKVDYLSFFLTIQVNDSVQLSSFLNRKDAFIQSLDPSKMQSSSEAKKIKYLYTKVHDSFFSKYELKALMPEVFKNGVYNCVTASALYSEIFTGTNIPHNIIETPNHVYLWAYPTSSNIKVESTDPLNGYFEYSVDFKKNFVNMMLKGKMISQAEMSSKSTDELFQTYFFKDSKISISELVGVQYYNHALYISEEKRFLDALHQAQKSYFLYPCLKTKQVLIELAANVYDETPFYDSTKIDKLLDLYSYNKELETSFVQNHIEAIVHELLINKNDVVASTKMYEKVLKCKNCPAELISSIKQVYNFERGRGFLIRGMEMEALDYFEISYSLNPINLDYQNGFSACLHDASLRSKKKPLDNLKWYRSYLDKYPKLIQTQYYTSGLLNLILLTTNQYLINDEVKNAEDQLVDFEKIIGENPNVKFEAGFVETVYSKLSVYYFRQGKNALALKHINKGLEYVPQSDLLLQRKKMISN